MAFKPDLAWSLNNLGRRFAKTGNDKEALIRYTEAIQTLAPHFLALPAAHVRHMRLFTENHLKTCKKLNQEPDAELLDPIQAILEKLEDPSG